MPNRGRTGPSWRHLAQYDFSVSNRRIDGIQEGVTMQFDEMGNRSGKTLMLLPGTACNYQANFLKVLDRLGEKGVRTFFKTVTPILLL